MKYKLIQKAVVLLAGSITFIALAAATGLKEGAREGKKKERKKE